MLCRAGVDVHLVARAAHLQAMRQRGLRVQTGDADFTVRPHVTDDPAEIGPVDYVFLGLKAYSYASAGPLLTPLLDDETAIVAAQNGIPWWYLYRHGGQLDGRRLESIDPDGTVSATIPPSRAIGCVVYPSATLAEPGVVLHLEGTRFALGEPDREETPRIRRWSQTMAEAGFKAPITAIRPQIWLKLIGNVAFNPVSALTRATLAEICQYSRSRSLVRQLMEEAVAVADALGDSPPAMISIERRIAAAERVGEHKTSMLQDLERGKPLELDAIVTAVLELAELVGIDAPTLRAIHAATALLANRDGSPRLETAAA
jgi:2-dehydropantoate 2-reductase